MAATTYRTVLMVTRLMSRVPAKAPAKAATVAAMISARLARTVSEASRSGVDREPGEVDQGGDDHAGADEGLRREAAFQQEGTAESALVAGQPAEEAAQDSAGRDVAPGDGQAVVGRPQLQERKGGHEHGDDQLDRMDRKRLAEEGVGEERRQVREPEERPDAGEAGQESRQPEEEHQVPIGPPAEQRELEEVGGEVDHGRLGHRHLHREEQGEDGHEQSAEPEAGEEREPRGDKGGEADDEVVHVCSVLASARQGVIEADHADDRARGDARQAGQRQRIICAPPPEISERSRGCHRQSCRRAA